MNINEAKLVSFVTILTGFALDVYQIEQLIKHMRDCSVKIDLTPLFRALVDNRKIDAIKEHRMLTGDALVESKNEIESILDKFTK